MPVAPESNRQESNICRYNQPATRGALPCEQSQLACFCAPPSHQQPIHHTCAHITCSDVDSSDKRHESVLTQKGPRRSPAASRAASHATYACNSHGGCGKICRPRGYSSVSLSPGRPVAIRHPSPPHIICLQTNIHRNARMSTQSCPDMRRVTCRCRPPSSSAESHRPFSSNHATFTVSFSPMWERLTPCGMLIAHADDIGLEAKRHPGCEA